MATYQVNSSSDDCRRILTPDRWNLDYAQQVAGSGSATAYQYGGGMRFTNILIPQGSIISEAHLSFQAYQTLSGGVCNTRISAEDIDNAPTFIDDAPTFDARWAGRTTARVDWDAISPWTYAQYYDSVDIKTVIQEIVDRSGWASGNAVVIFWEDFEDRSTHAAENFRSARTFDNIPASAPKLVVTHISPFIPFIPKIMMF